MRSSSPAGEAALPAEEKGRRGEDEKANTRQTYSLISFPHADAERTPADSQRLFANRKTQFRNAFANDRFDYLSLESERRGGEEEETQT